MEIDTFSEYNLTRFELGQLLLVILYSSHIKGYLNEEDLFHRNKTGLLKRQTKYKSDSDTTLDKDMDKLNGYLNVLLKMRNYPERINESYFQDISTYNNLIKPKISRRLLYLHFQAFSSSGEAGNEAEEVNQIIQYLLRKIYEKYKVHFKYENGIIYPAETKVDFIDSVNVFLYHVFKLDNSKSGETLFYRGHSDLRYECIPSLFRIDNWDEKEKRMKDELTIYCSKEIDNCETNFEKLVLMQHYNLPTRLLDVTSNPLVALYFACASGQEHFNGEVIIYDIPKETTHSFSSHDVALISCISELTSDQKLSITQNNLHAKETLENLKKICLNDHSTFNKNIAISDLKKCLFVKPKLNNNRIERQSGAFLIMGLLDKSEAKLKHSKLRIKRQMIFVKKESKNEILKQLSTLSINKAKLFPEIDSVAKHINELYM